MVKFSSADSKQRKLTEEYELRQAEITKQIANQKSEWDAKLEESERVAAAMKSGNVEEIKSAHQREMNENQLRFHLAEQQIHADYQISIAQLQER